MKKFTFMLIAALFAVTTFAGVPLNPTVFQKANTQTLATKAVKSQNKKAPAQNVVTSLRRADAEAATPPAGAEEQIFQMTGINYYETNSSIAEDEWESRVSVVFDGSDVYIKGLAPYYMGNSWVKGTLADGVLTIPDQFIGTHATYGIDFYVAGVTTLDDETYTDAVFSYDATAETFTSNNIVINYATDYGWLDAYGSLTLTKLSADDIPQTVAVPDGLVTQELPLEGRSYYSNTWNDISTTATIGFEGDDVYLKGLVSLIPDAWIKGAKQGDKLVFPTGQYVGTYGGNDMYLVGYDTNTQEITDISFTISGDNFYILDNLVFENGKADQLYYYRYYASGLTIGTDSELELITLPEGVEVTTVPFVGNTLSNGEPSPFSTTVNIGWDGNDLYIQGLNPYTDAWIKGTKADDGTVTFASPQNFGVYNDAYQFYLVGTDEETGELQDVVFKYNPLLGTYTLQNGLVVNGEKYSLYYYRWYAAGSVLGTPREFTSLDFNSYDAESFPVSSNSSHDGDITEDIIITTDKASLTVSPSTTNTANRFWLSNGKVQLRVYGGTLTFDAPEGRSIEKITFNTGNSWNANTTANVGEIASKVWTGNANQVVVTIGGNTQINSITVDLSAVPFDYEKIAITPAEGQVESLENFVISLGGQEVTVNEDALITLVGDNETIDGGIELLGDGTVSVGLADKVTTPGNYTLNIPENAIFFNGTSLDPLSFKYTIGTPAEYTIDPAEGEVESLSAFTITFNNYMVEETDEAAAILFNTETEAEVEGSVYAIGGGKAAYISLAQEVTTPGTYQLIILDGSLKKTIDDSFLPELAFDYTIVGGGEPVQEDVLVEVPATATVEEWTLEGTYNTNSGGTVQQQIATEVAFDGNDIYVKGLAYYFEESWIKGTINGSTATFPTGQFVGEDEYGKEYLLGYDGAEITDIQFAYDAEAKTLTQETNYILENGDSREKLSFWGYWSDVVLYAGAPEVLDPVEAPADLATETYLFKSQAIEYDEDTEENSLVDYEIQVQVGFDGDDLYIQGLSADAPELWVKATKNDNGQYVIPANQYMGQLSLLGGYYVFDYFFTATDGTDALLDVVLNYDADTQTLSTDQWLALNGSKNTLYYYLLFNGATITKINEVAATPADPEVVAINFTGTYPNAQFNVPATGTEGEALLTNKLFYTIWIEKDDVQQPYTFTAELYNQDFDEDVTEVPYSHEGWDFYAGAERVYFEEILDELETWSKIGIQSIYYGADERRVSNVVWAENPNYTTGISNINVNDNDATFFDLQGRTASKTQKGLLIMKAADGKTIKVVRK